MDPRDPVSAMLTEAAMPNDNPIIRVTTVPIDGKPYIPVLADLSSSVTTPTSLSIVTWRSRIFTELAELASSADYINCKIQYFNMNDRGWYRLYVELTFPAGSIYAANKYELVISSSENETPCVVVHGLLHPNVHEDGSLLLKLDPKATICGIIDFIEDFDTEVHAYGEWNKNIFDILVTDREKFKGLSNKHWEDARDRMHEELPELGSGVVFDTVVKSCS